MSFYCVFRLLEVDMFSVCWLLPRSLQDPITHTVSGNTKLWHLAIKTFSWQIWEMISLHIAGARARCTFSSTSLALHSWSGTEWTWAASWWACSKSDGRPHMWRAAHMAGDRRMSGRRGDGGRQHCESAGACSTCSAMTCASDEASSAFGPSADRPAAAQHPSKLLIPKDSPTLCKLLTY